MVRKRASGRTADAAGQMPTPRPIPRAARRDAAVRAVPGRRTANDADGAASSTAVGVGDGATDMAADGRRLRCECGWRVVRTVVMMGRGSMVVVSTRCC